MLGFEDVLEPCALSVVAFLMGEVNTKARRLQLPCEKSFRRALVYEGNLAKSVEADGFFDAIIPFRRLLNI